MSRNCRHSSESTRGAGRSHTTASSGTAMRPKRLSASSTPGRRSPDGSAPTASAASRQSSGAAYPNSHRTSPPSPSKRSVGSGTRSWSTAGKVRCSPAVDQERVPLPTLRFEGEGGEVRWLFGYAAPEDCRDAALAVGAEPSGDRRPGVLDALRRFGRMAVPELAVVCDLPAPRVDSELAQLALEWRVRPVPVLAGRLWGPASAELTPGCVA